ncbi:MAG: hypothetical protein RLZZ69_1370, partial [Cyanobacteriota bacterium]
FLVVGLDGKIIHDADSVFLFKHIKQDKTFTDLELSHFNSMYELPANKLSQNFPYLRDSNQDVAKAFKTKVLPTVYLLDGDAVIRYQGKIDDGAESEQNHHYLRNSVMAMLAGEKIERNYVDPVGTDINWRP